MADWFNAATWTVLGGLAALNLLVLLYATESPAGTWLRPRVRRVLRALSRRADLEWLDWQPLTVAMAIAFAAVAAYGIGSGQYGCYPRGTDAVGILDSGRAFLAGQNPFNVMGCGATLTEPYGLAAILIAALGSLGGLDGVYAVWGAVAVSLLPLTWAVGGPDRRFVLVYVATSVLLVPIVASQIDGATNAIVPATVLLAIYLSRRRELFAAAVGGFLSTARFPNLFPVLGATGANQRFRYASFAVATTAFGVVTVVSYLLWGTEFLDPVILSQVGRRSFSLNLYGVFLLQNALPSSTAIEGLQALLTVALVVAVFFRVRSAVASAAIVLVGIALLTPFLSFTILLWLLPVALVSARARWWLWGVAFVGSLNYDLALNVWALEDKVAWPSEVMDGVLTVLLLALFLELWRGELARTSPRPAAGDRAGGAPPG